MAKLVKTDSGSNNLIKYDDDYIQAALALAGEIGINLEETNNFSSGGNYTKYSLPSGVRFSVTYFDSGKFEWNGENQEPDFKEQFFKKAGDEIIEISDFNEIGGYIVEFELQPRLANYDEDTKTTKTTCSLIGYQTTDMDTGENLAVRALPPVPLKSMYQWVGDNLSYTSPEPTVDRLGFIGSRGEACATCIRNGHSTMQVNTRSGPKTESCSVRGVLYMVVHELSKVTKKAAKVAGQDPEEVKTTYKVTDLCDENGVAKAPFLLALNTTSLGLRGAWNNVPRITGLFHHVSGLNREFKGKDPRASMKFHFTTITLRKKTDGNKYQSDFSKYPANLSEMKEAFNVWQAAKPNKDVALISPSEYAGFTGSSLGAPSVEESAAVEEVEFNF